jgi:hypothetical protein
MRNGKFNLLEVIGLTLLTVGTIVTITITVAILTRGW